MVTLIYDVDDLQAMQDDLDADYELANDIDASATSGWTDLTDKGVWAASTEYTAPNDRVSSDHDVIFCRRRGSSDPGAFTAYVEKMAFGLRPSSRPFATFRYSLGTNFPDVVPSGGATLSICTADSDYKPLETVASYYFPSIIHQPGSTSIWDIWLTFPEGHRITPNVSSYYAIVLEPDVHDYPKLALVSAYAYWRVPEWTPASSTYNNPKSYYWSDSSFTEYTNMPNCVAYSQRYYSCSESHTSLSRIDPDKWISTEDTIVAAGFNPIGSNSSSTYRYSYPTSDIAQTGGGWSIYPDDGIYWSKVDDWRSYIDSGTTYIHRYGGSGRLTFGCPGTSIPSDATSISVSVIVSARRSALANTAIEGVLRITGGDYLHSDSWKPGTGDYTANVKTFTWSTNPFSGEAWTVSDINGGHIEGIGVDVDSPSGHTYITQAYLRIYYYRQPSGFTGTLDGKGHTISDLYINRADEYYVGLFSLAGSPSTITNVRLTNPVVKGYRQVGALVGNCQGAAIDNVIVSGLALTGYRECGGLIGEARGNSITNSSVEGTLAVSNRYSGGFIGIAHTDGISGNAISRCYANCTISGDSYSGGFIGQSYYSDIDECYSLGGITGNDYIGGFIGQCYYGSINNCYSRTNVTGNRYIAGFVALCGSTVPIGNCYSTGVVSGNSNLDGFSGGGVVANSFWDTETSGMTTSAGGTGKTTAEMKAILTFLTWDIAETTTNRNNGYPFLSWEIGESGTIWLIYSGTTCYTIPDCYDHKGRVAKGARVRAYRIDTHELITEGVLDEHGTATLCGLPIGVDVMFMITWGGISQPHKTRWFYRHIGKVEEGGTNATDAATALVNLGLAVGTNAQAYDAGLTDIAGLTPGDGVFMVGDGSNWITESGQTARDSLGADNAVMLWHLILED